MLRIVHCVITRFLLKQAAVKRCSADTGAVTLIQRFGSAANLNIHLHCLVLDGVYRRTEAEPDFQEARAPTRAELEGLLDKIIVRLMKMLTRQGHLVEEEGVSYIAPSFRADLSQTRKAPGANSVYDAWSVQGFKTGTRARE